jgi:alpha-glucosidase (family GH31 glycosyl hydrolase)
MIDFTKTAANAPLCWWGHEMMRTGSKVSDNAELFTRTNQFGAWSPVFTSWGNADQNNLWWDMPEPFASATRESLKDRQQLLPYRYSAAAKSHVTGLCSHRGMHVRRSFILSRLLAETLASRWPVSTCRFLVTSLQFSYPLESDAYRTPGQFLLGNDLIVAPAISPVQNPPIPAQGGCSGGSVGVSVWVPPAPEVWLDFNAPAAAAFLPGWMLYNASIFTVPVLVRSGSIIPLLPRNLTSLPGISGRA